MTDPHEQRIREIVADPRVHCIGCSQPIGYLWETKADTCGDPRCVRASLQAMFDTELALATKQEQETKIKTRFADAYFNYMKKMNGEAAVEYREAKKAAETLYYGAPVKQEDDE